MPSWGNAVSWWQNAINQGYAVGNEPVPGSIAVWSGDYYGHVAYVTANLGNNRFTVDEEEERTKIRHPLMELHMDIH